MAARSSSLTLADGSDISLNEATSCWLGNVSVSTSSRSAVTCAVTTTDHAERLACCTCSTICADVTRRGSEASPAGILGCPATALPAARLSALDA